MNYQSEWNRTASDEEQAARRRSRITLVVLLVAALLVLTVAFTLLHRHLAAQLAVVTDTSVSSLAAEAAAEPAGEADINTVVPVGSGLLVSFLDVGQGDCIFLRSPSGKTMLVDGGPSGSFDSIDAYLVSLGVVGLDVVVASHLHADHIGGLISIVNTYPIGEFYYPPFTADSETYFDLLDALSESQASVYQPLAGVDTLIHWDDEVEVRILGPYEAVYQDFNDTSYLIRVRYGNTAVLLTGDTTELGEALALKAQPDDYFKADVLKVAHHGSADATFEAFLDAVSPAIAVISVGADNDYGHPNQSLLDRLSERGITVYRTDLNGTVTLLLDGIGVQVIE